MTTFTEVVKKHFEKLDLYTHAITRAHGKNHPEAFDVRDLFLEMNGKITAANGASVNLDEEFQALREVTNQYTVPDDVCETFAGTYEMLAEADQAYHQA